MVKNYYKYNFGRPADIYKNITKYTNNMKNFFQHIRIKYNSDICTTLKDYCNLQKRLAKTSTKLRFLLSCREFKIVPKHISNTTTYSKSLFHKMTSYKLLLKSEEIFHFKMLNLEISETVISIKEIKKTASYIYNKIKTTLNDMEYTSFISNQINMYKYIEKQSLDKQLSKKQKLIQTRLLQSGLIFNENWFINQTDIAFPDEIQWLLSLGNKFALPITNTNFSPVHMIADIEQYIQTIENEREKEITRSNIAARVVTYKRHIKNTALEKLILVIHKTTKKFLKQYENEIIITNADKGNKTVVMYKKDYNKKMNDLLEDKSTYKTTRTDPTNKLVKTNNNIVNDLYKNSHIDKQLKYKLFCSAAHAPRIYGLPKIHKPGLPLRPISSSINVPCYNMSKHIGEILKHIISEEFNIKNSLTLKEKLIDLELHKDEVLISFDVVSLFTNIPVHLAIKNIMAQWNVIQQHTKIPKSQFLKMLEFCLKDNNYLKFDTKIYHQTFGMPMGNPLSPTIADIILDSLLKTKINELQEQNINIKFIVKYVDDILAIIYKKDIDIILNTLNNYHDKLKFTTELEKNNSLPYLDINLHRVNNKIVFNWYTKPTWSGRMMNFHSTQPLQQKINTANNLIKKVLTISDKRFHKDNLTKITDVLTKNGYPHYLIKNLLHKTQHQKQQTLQTSNVQSGNSKRYYSISYIPNLTNNKILQQTINNNNVTFAHKTNQSLNQIFTRTKAPIQKEEQQNVVYEISCNGQKDENCELVYIGTTKRALGTRIAEHRTDAKNKKLSTALSQHLIESGHTADLENVKIIDRENKTNKRMTLESLRIQQKLTKAMNTKEDKDNTNYNYSTAIT